MNTALEPAPTAAPPPDMVAREPWRFHREEEVRDAIARVAEARREAEALVAAEQAKYRALWAEVQGERTAMRRQMTGDAR